MTRTIKSVKRPDVHIYVEDKRDPADHRGARPCAHPHCGLPKVNSVHITSEEAAAALPPVPEEDVSDRIVGEGGQGA